MIPAAMDFLSRRRVVPPPEPPLDGPPTANRFAFIDSLKAPYGPDKLVFGRWEATPDNGAPRLWCARCDVKWGEAAGQRCWHCGGAE